jgi:hypothetical protein
MSHTLWTGTAPLELTWTSRRRDSEHARPAEIPTTSVVAVAQVGSVAQAITAVTRTAPLGLGLRTTNAAACDADAPPAALLDLRFPQPVLMEANGAVLHVRPGATWTDVLAATRGRGRAAPMPFDLLGDPLSFFLDAGLPIDGRLHGLASSRVRAVTLVTPAGGVVVVTPASEPDLFWALRGGGAGFGVVVDVAVDLVPVTAMHRSAVAFHTDDPGRVLAAWQDWCAGAPLTASSRMRLSARPSGGVDVVADLWVTQPGVADFAATSRVVTTFSQLERGSSPTTGASASASAMAQPERPPVRAYLTWSEFGSWATTSPIASGSAEVQQLGGRLADEPCRAGAVDRVTADFLVIARTTSPGDPALTPRCWVVEPERYERVEIARTRVDPSGRFAADVAAAPAALMDGPATVGR